VRLLLDTNAYAALFRGNQAVVDRVRRAEQVLISAIVAGELLFGFRNGTRYEANARRLDDFLASAYVVFLPVTRITADRFARIAAML
jgi:tRNA(fMet)-specific endonuclease VapC